MGGFGIDRYINCKSNCDDHFSLSRFQLVKGSGCRRRQYIPLEEIRIAVSCNPVLVTNKILKLRKNSRY